MSHYMTDKLEFIGQASFTWMETVSLRKWCNLCFKIHYVKVFRYFLSLFLSRKKKRKKLTKESKKKDRGRFWTADFQGMERSAVHTFLQKCSPTLRIFGVFHPLFSNLKLKTHLREHSRQSPVPKIRSCFLSEFSGIGRTCFFFFLWFAFFLLFQKKEERNERKNKIVSFYTISPSDRILNF